MSWTTIALVALGVVVLLAILWFVVAMSMFRWFRKESRRMDEDFERHRDEMRRRW